MDQLPYRNLPGSMQHVEKWLEKLLATSITDDNLTANASLQLDASERTPYPATRQFQLDRQCLDALGLDKEAQDRIYRTFFIYCNGIHEFIRDFGRFDQELPARLWITFIRLFQYYDVTFQENFAAFIKKQQDERAVRTISEQSVALAALQRENAALYDDLTVARADASGSRHEQQMAAASAQLVEAQLRARAVAAEQQLGAASERTQHLEQCRSEYKGHLATSREMIVKLLKELTSTEERANKFVNKCEGLEKEYSELHKKYKGQDATFQKTAEELVRFKEKAMTLAQARDELFDLSTRLTADKNQLQAQVEGLEADKIALYTIQDELAALGETATSALAQVSRLLPVHVDWGMTLRARCLATSELAAPAGVTFDSFEYNPQQAASTIERLEAHIQDMQSADLGMSLHDGLEATVQRLRTQQRTIALVPSEIERVQAASFLANQLQSCSSFLLALGEKAAAYRVLWDQHMGQQASLASSNLLGAVYRATIDRLQVKVDGFDAVLYQRLREIHDRDDKIASLTGDLHAVTQRAEKLEPFKIALLDLEPRHAQLVDDYKVEHMAKLKLELALSRARVEIETLREVSENLEVARQMIHELEHNAEEREAHVKYLQTEVRSLSAQIAKQEEASSEYDGLFSAILSAVGIVDRVSGLGEEGQVFEAGELSEGTAVERAADRSLRAAVAEMISHLQLQCEPFLVDDNPSLSDKEKAGIDAIARQLQALPGKVLYLLRFSDELRVAQQQAQHWQREYESIRAFSAKERSRLTRLVLPNKDKGNDNDKDRSPER